jgi:hypothetical protein
MSKKILRCVWSVDCDPADVFRSDAVSMSSETACLTAEAFTIAISFGYMPTVRASTAGIPRLNIDNRHSCKFSLVPDKLLQLVETPRMDCSPLATTANRYPRTYTFQVFECYTSEGVFSLLNNPFGDYMVDCTGEPMLFSATFLEQTPTRFGAFRLKSASDFSVPRSDSVEFFAHPSFAVVVCGDVSYANVYAEKVFGYERFSFRHFDSCSKIEHAISEEQICLSTDFVDSCLLVHADLHGYSLSTLQSEYAYGFKSFPTENALVIDDCSMQVKSSFSLFAGFVCVGYFADGSDSHLSRNFEPSSYFIVNEVMELPIVESFSLKSCFGDAVAGFVEGYHSFFKHVELLRSRMDLNCKRLLHTYMDRTIPYLTFILSLLPALKDMLNDMRIHGGL